MRSAARRRFLRVAVCRERIDEAEMRRQYGLAPDEPLSDSSSSSATRRAYFTQFVSPLVAAVRSIATDAGAFDVVEHTAFANGAAGATDMAAAVEQA